MEKRLIIGIYVNRIKTRITFKTKTRYYLELLAPETMTLLGSTKNKITKNENGESVPHAEISEIVLAHYNIVILYFSKCFVRNFRIKNDQNSEPLEIEDKINIRLVIN